MLIKAQKTIAADRFILGIENKKKLLLLKIDQNKSPDKSLRVLNKRKIVIFATYLVKYKIIK